jgi:photosystem II stability/assembly factor-like uncharacterized protein
MCLFLSVSLAFGVSYFMEYNITMRTICIFLFSLLLVPETLPQWTVISTQGNTAVSFPSENTGYSTANGITKKTTNGGYNWSSLSGGNLTGIFFINDFTGWVVGYPGYIGRTTNSGSFTQQQTGVQDRLNDVYFINPDTGWVVGGDFSVERIFKTTNGGLNWTAQTSGTANKLFSVYFIDANTGWSVGGPSAPKIIKTTNGGTSWFLQFTSVTTPLYSVMFADSNTGWAVAGYLGGETIIKTTNGGTNWFSQSSGDNRYLRDCYVKNPMTAFAVGQSGKLIVTGNGGDNWYVINTGSSVELWSIDFANDSIGYAIGSTVVLKTTNGGITFVNNESNKVPDEFKLYQNYPNPFNPETIIKFSIPALSKGGVHDISVIIYNLQGKEITNLIPPLRGGQEGLAPGLYEVHWNASPYPSGIYFCRLAAGDYVQTRRMVLVK